MNFKRRRPELRHRAYGLCLEGPLKGTQLKQVILVPKFWFAWSQFRPGTRVFTAR